MAQAGVIPERMKGIVLLKPPLQYPRKVPVVHQKLLQTYSAQSFQLAFSCWTQL